MQLSTDFELIPYADNPGVYSVWLGNVQQGAYYSESFQYRKLDGKTWGPLTDPPWHGRKREGLRVPRREADL